MKQKWVVLGFALLFGLALAAAPSPADAELKVGVSGYVKLDLQYGDKITGSVPSPGPSDTPLDIADPEKDHSQTIVDARQSRLRVTFADEVAGVKLSGRIETDFFTTEGNAQVGNSRGLRLRHAFARADHPSGFFLQAGQYWSLFMNETIAQPDLVDFNGPAGQLFARQPQLRLGYKNPLARGMGDLVFEVDVEKHSNDAGVGNVVGTATNPGEGQGVGQSVPLVAGKISWLHPVIQAEVAGTWARNNVFVTPTGGQSHDDAWGLQVSAQAGLDRITGLPLTIFGHYQHLDGLGRLGNGDFPSAILVGTSVTGVESDGFYVGASFAVTKDTSINGVFGWAEADENVAGGFTGTDLEQHQSIHVNILHKFWQRWQAGIEYRRFDVEAFNGDEGDVNFVHGALWFFF